MARKEKRWFDLGLAAIFLLALLIPLTYPFLFARVIPMTVGGFGLALVIWEIIASRKLQEEPSDDTQEGSWRVIVIWLALLGVMVYFLGIMVSIPIYTLLYLRLKGGDKWITSLVNSAVSTVVFYIVFVFALEAQLYKGLIWETLVRYW